jgi:4-hydroxybenzoate polyprenyltransferase
VNVRAATPARHGLADVVVALRPRQWTKNLLLFAGLLFAAKLGDDERWVPALAAFASYCAVSSAAYLVNDVRDAQQDAKHPTKRRRPVASGAISRRTALAMSAALLCIGLLLTVPLGARPLAFLAAFVIVQLAYTLALKRVVVVDVLVIGALFVLRAAAGAAAIHVHISGWLLVCTGLLSLFLAVAKRRSELVLVLGKLTSGRPTLAHYSLPVLDRLLPLLGGAAIGAYGAYTSTAHDGLEMIATVPFVVFGVARYLYLVWRRDLGEEPEQVLLTDGATIAAVALWAVTAAMILTS